VQFRHSVGSWSLEADDHGDVAIELAGFEGLENFILVREAARRGFDQPAFLIDGASL
jgi:hypothetical protein